MLGVLNLKTPTPILLLIQTRQYTHFTNILRLFRSDGDCWLDCITLIGTSQYFKVIKQKRNCVLVTQILITSTGF